jgi:hypothetical protein
VVLVSVTLTLPDGGILCLDLDRVRTFIHVTKPRLKRLFTNDDIWLKEE